MPQTSIAGGPSGKATREMNFNKQDSRSVLQVLSDQQLIEKLKRINSEDSSDNDDGDVSIGSSQGNESPGIHVASGGGGGGVGAGVAALSHSQENLVAGGGLPNEISAPYEVPQFPIEQIENKLQLQRQLNAK
uniref:(northern house mosquito) hypothetical protein n=1 Tax=Culex pipiens TaxID=7175 RepID=A0A8D8AL84_CULPI